MLGDSGPLTIGTTNFSVDSAGSVSADGKNVGKLRIVQFENPAALKKIGGNLYEGTGEKTPQTGSYTIRQGGIELSNVDHCARNGGHDHHKPRL